MDTEHMTEQEDRYSEFTNLVELYQTYSEPTQRYLLRIAWKHLCSKVRAKGYKAYCGYHAGNYDGSVASMHDFVICGHADGWPSVWFASYEYVLHAIYWLEQQGTALIPGTHVRVRARGNCYCSEIPCEEDRSVVCDYCKYNGQIGMLAKIDEHNQDGDFYGVVFPGGKPVYFWQQELHPVMPTT